MASSKTKETKFFGGNRRELVLQDFHVLMSRGEEKRMKLAVRMPLLGASAVAVPTWVGNPFLEMAKEDSMTALAKMPNVMCEGMTFTVYSTEKIKGKTLAVTGTMLIAFQLQAEGSGDKREVYLCFTIYCPANPQLRDWAWDHLHKTFYGVFEYSQTEMDFDGEEAEEGDAEPEEEEDEEELVGVGSGRRR